MKSQFKKADASGAAFALIFGEDEVAQGLVAVKPLRAAGAAQYTRTMAAAADWAAELLVNA
jgi:histidyl-tRNA synthetase